MVRKIFSKVAWMARATTTVVGLAIMLALVFGVATTAIGATGGNFILGKANAAGTPSGLTASIAKPTLALINKSTDAAATALNITVDAGNPPLKVNAAAGKAVNLDADKVDGKSAADFYAQGSKVADSSRADFAQSADSAGSAVHVDTAGSANNADNADTLDGKGSSSFVSSSYFVQKSVDNSQFAYTTEQVLCEEGDLVLGGGYNGLESSEGTVVTSNPTRLGMGDGSVRDTWYMEWKNASPGTDSNVLLTVFCADLGAAH